VDDMTLVLGVVDLQRGTRTSGAANTDASTFISSGPGLSAVPRSRLRLQETRSVDADAVGPGPTRIIQRGRRLGSARDPARSSTVWQRQPPRQPLRRANRDRRRYVPQQGRSAFRFLADFLTSIWTAQPKLAPRFLPDSP
jgi:hypothetical protein